VTQAKETLSEVRGAQTADETVRRRPGRPTGKLDRRELLMDAALALFARQGIPSTSLKMIADEVGLTPAMAHYYFNGRYQLIDALVEERLLPVCISIGEAFGAEGDDPMTVISTFVQRLVQATEECPWLASLWVREMLGEGGDLKERVDRRLEETGSRKDARRLENWRRQNILNDDVESALVFTSIMALTLLPLAASRKGSDSVSRDRLVKHVTTLLGGGLF